MESKQGQPILCKAAVAYGPKQPLSYEDVWVAAPKKGEVRIKVIANALCHTDIYTLDGCDPEGLFPCILGHEATAVVESIGEGVTSVKPGDIVIPCYTPQCLERDCVFCQSKSNLCPKIRATQGKGLMPDGTSRFTNKDGKQIFHFMGCSTFSQYTVIAEISAAKINPNADLNKVCVLGCGVSTGWGATYNNTNVTPGSSVAVWGLGAVGLSVIQAAKIQGATRIYAIDVNSEKAEVAKNFGATEFINAKDSDAKQVLLEKQKWGVNFTYDCTGNVAVMRSALEASHRGFGESCVIGVAESGKEIATRPFQLVTGRKWVGTAFGGWKSREDVPKLVNKVITGELPIDAYITHFFDSLADVNKSIDALHSGKCLRAVVEISDPPTRHRYAVKVLSSARLHDGVLKVIEHWSDVNQCNMTFSLYLPEGQVNKQRGKPFPALYFLAGLTCTHENAPTKSGFAAFAREHKIAVVFPDTSPRNHGIEGINKDYSWGQSAGYYCNATTDKYKTNFNMFSYVNQELPRVVSQHFPVSFDNKSVTGFSMGGHGALICGLKTGQYKSVSAFAPISHPSVSEWGTKAFEEFLGSKEAGKQYDATEVVLSGKFHKVPLFVEVGSADKHHGKLHIKDFLDAAHNAGLKLKYQSRDHYDHSFWYVSSFIEEHFKFHSQFLNSWQ